MYVKEYIIKVFYDMRTVRHALFCHVCNRSLYIISVRVSNIYRPNHLWHVKTIHSLVLRCPF